MPAAGGITSLSPSLSFSFSPVTIVATLFIDVTVPGHDIPGGRNESLVQSGDVGCLPSPIYSSLPSCRIICQGCGSYFRDYLFTAVSSSLAESTFSAFLYIWIVLFVVSDNEGIVDRLAKRPGIPNDLSRNNLSRSWS